MKTRPDLSTGMGRPRLRRVPSGLGGSRRLAGYVIATLGTAAMALGVLPFRADITPLSKGFGFLIVVVGSAVVGGLGPGLAASLLGFLTFNFLFLPPYDTFVIGRPEYVVVLFVFLGLSVLISSILARSMKRAEVAEAREREVSLLQHLSAELVALPPGPEGYTELLRELARVLGFGAGALFVMDPEARGLREAAVVGARPGELSPQTDVASEQRPVRLPLTVGRNALGLIVLYGRPRDLTAAESQVLRTLCDQLALVLERDRLLRQAVDIQILQRAEDLRRSLLAAVSHDLRTPLAVIMATVTDLLSEDAPHDPAYVRESLQSVNAETNRLASLVANLLDMSRIEQGMFTPHLQAVDLGEALVRSGDLAGRNRPTLHIALGVPDCDVAVRADPVFLDRVLANLVENAAKAAIENGTAEIEVRAHAASDRVVVRVVDHGKGIPASVHEQLFYPFYQLREREPRLGTGLGLPIARGFLGLMGGEIWIEDTPGGGATFAFSLPLAGLPSRNVRVGTSAQR